MKQIGTDVKGEVVFAWRTGDTYGLETPVDGAVMTRDNVEQLIAELESLLRED